MRGVLFIGLLFLPKFFFSQNEHDSSFKNQIKDFEKFINKVDANFLDEINIEKLILNAKKQTIKSLDPYSNFYTKEESEQRNKSWRGISYAGI
jgi:carboxyl-terminal processing protease